eukprot:CAMPEP_0172745212 /NCGR_PEP_ID=MMETSP1074-20121228/137390_1 /TAXON_ID=2916 /ORGANISM="Ceratium fusus, Strain PA161109" /LENGTH=37 /DNA_ID= /DNA_START= /DNA_END= /DNA_ORIENTATION=
MMMLAAHLVVMTSTVTAWRSGPCPGGLDLQIAPFVGS